MSTVLIDISNRNKKTRKCECTGTCSCGVEIFVSEPKSDKPKLQFNYSKPNYEKIKNDTSYKEGTQHFTVWTFDEIKDIENIEFITSYENRVTPDELTKKDKVTTVDPEGNEFESEMYYLVFAGISIRGGRQIETFHAEEFYYEMTRCCGVSANCEKLIQGKHFTDTISREFIQSQDYINTIYTGEQIVNSTCSACLGEIMFCEKIDQPIVPPKDSDADDWYQGSKPIKILSWGAGTDSTALILKYGDQVDEIIMADTGAEEIETYEYIKYFLEHLRKDIRDKITIIQNTREGKIDDWHLENKLQPMPFANRQCTDKWKLRVIHRYVRKTYGTKAVFDMLVGINYDEQIARERPLPTDDQLDWWIDTQIEKSPEDLIKLAKRQGISVTDYRERIRNAMQTGAYIVYECTKCGKDVNGATHEKCPKFDKQDAPAISTHVAKGGCQYARNVYPLCEDKIGKQDELAVFEKDGFQVPPKSGCYFCPMKGKKEWNELKDTHENLYENTKLIEKNSKASLKIMNMSTEKKDTMRCSCSNGLYDAEDEDEISVEYVTKKITGRGI